MTPTEMTAKLLPLIRESADLAKPDLLATMPWIHRRVVSMAWVPLFAFIVPIIVRIAIEVLVARVGPLISAMIRGYLDTMIGFLKEEYAVQARDLLGLFSTPTNQFHPALVTTIYTSPSAMAEMRVGASPLKSNVTRGDK